MPPKEERKRPEVSGSLLSLSSLGTHQSQKHHLYRFVYLCCNFLCCGMSKHNFFIMQVWYTFLCTQPFRPNRPDDKSKFEIQIGVYRGVEVVATKPSPVGSMSQATVEFCKAKRRGDHGSGG